jgi:hypothetical protein
MTTGFERLTRKRYQRAAEDDNPDVGVIPGLGPFVKPKRRDRRGPKRRFNGQQTVPLNRYPGFPGANKQD